MIAEHGANAKIVAVQVLTSGGVQGFFARRRYQVEVDVPDGTARDAHAFDLPARAGLARLLADADAAEARPDSVPRLSTSSVDFDAIMADLSFNTAQILPAIEEPTVFHRAPLSGSGDLIAVVGIGADALEVARGMSGAFGRRALAIAGNVLDDGLYRLGDRRSVVAARAAGVRDEHPVFVAIGLPRAGLDDDGAFALHLVHADQVWVVVDVGRKPADSQRWVRAVRAAVHVDAVAVIGAESTTTPDTVAELGLQVGWSETVR